MRHCIRKEKTMSELFPDIQGWLHRTPEEAIRENQRLEGDFSRGSTGECPQDPSNVPPPPPPPPPKPSK